MEDYILVIHYGGSNLTVSCSSENHVKDVLVMCAKSKKNLFPFGLIHKGEWLWHNEKFDRYGDEAKELMEILKRVEYEGGFILTEELSKDIWEEDEYFKEGYHDVEEFYP